MTMMKRAGCLCRRASRLNNASQFAVLEKEGARSTRSRHYSPFLCKNDTNQIATSTTAIIRWHTTTGDQATFQKRSEFSLLPPDLIHHVRDCLWQGSSTDTLARQISTGFLVAFIGTGSSAAVRNRGFAATVLRFGMPNTYLFDVGEGTLRQLKSTRIKFHFINKIFITHMHGDHVFGLPSLVLAMQVATTPGDPDEIPPLEIFGPVGLYSYLVSSLASVGAKINVRPIKVYELVGTTPHHRPIETFTFQGVTRHTIQPNGDGTWTIHETGKKRHLGSCVVSITAAEVIHLPGMPCFGYCVDEVYMHPPVDVEKARALGLESPEKLAMLRSGATVLSDDGNRWVDPESVLGLQPSPRKFVLLSDAFAIPPVMTDLCQDADVLVHEATLPEREIEVALRRGHSTPSMAGRFAQAVNPKVLVLNHLGPHNSMYARRAIQDAMAEIKNGTTRVIAACDFMEIMIPQGGFHFDHPADQTKSSDGSFSSPATTNASVQGYSHGTSTQS